MTKRPHDLVDLYLAPVALTLDAELEALSGLDPEQLHREVALRTNREPESSDQRAEAVIAAVTHLVELHDWNVSWTDRGLEVAHDKNRLVLGAPASVHKYIEAGA